MAVVLVVVFVVVCNMDLVVAIIVGSDRMVFVHKVVVVLAERNWNQRTGLIDSPNDRGPNVAAEAGLSLVNALYHPAPDARTSGPQALAAAQILP